ncbi:MAG: SDR family NAD(P)-dependent oxidoreductase [Acidobacteria bacterium]|nr:SDR family NAD(P)-dependent oxidoreductase [Acidobacteriota bacterium]
MKSLAGKIAVVAGATRGAGRGIALALGEAGATVYCTGRSSREHPRSRPETIEETAEMVTARGGNGIAVRVDHLVPADVEALFERVGKFDILVNDIWGGDELTKFGEMFWEGSVEQNLQMMHNAIDTHIIASRYGVPRLLENGGGLVVEITDGDFYGYRGHFFYDLVKTTVIRMAFGMAFELRKHNVAAVAVTPGFLRSEFMLEHFKVTEENWRDGAKIDPNFLVSETPLFVGRAVAALAADPNIMQKSGRVFASWNLAEEYGFDDADGSRPHWGRHFVEAYREVPICDEGFYRYWFDGPIDALLEKMKM